MDSLPLTEGILEQDYQELVQGAGEKISGVRSKGQSEIPGVYRILHSLGASDQNPHCFHASESGK